MSSLKEAKRRPQRDVTICGGKDRSKRVFTSDGNQIEVNMASRSASEQKVYFLLKYEGICKHYTVYYTFVCLVARKGKY